MALAQLPVEVMVGHQRVQHEFFFFKDLDSSQRVNLFSMARFAVDYQDAQFNSGFVSSQLTYNLTPSWGLSAGANYAEGQAVPLVALSYTLANEKGDFFINLFPTVFVQEDWSYELFGMLFYTPALTRDWYPFNQWMFGLNFSGRLDVHQYSYQQLRLGLGYRQWGQIGLGLDYEWIGPWRQWLTLANVGLFVRKEL